MSLYRVTIGKEPVIMEIKADTEFEAAEIAEQLFREEPLDIYDIEKIEEED